MAALQFEKDTEERSMFTDLWELCQKYWIAEKTDEYWDSFLKDIEEFETKHPGELMERWMSDLVIVKEKESKKWRR